MARPARQYDVGILGGGPAGCTAAIALAKRGLKVALMRRRARMPATVVETLIPPAQALLEELGIWQAFTELSPTEVWGVVSRWENDEPREHDYYGSVLDRGWHIVRRDFDEMLERAAVAASVDAHGPALSVSPGRDPWIVQTQARSRVNQIGASFLIDATGRNGWLATRLGIERIALNEQICLAAVDNTSHVASSPDRRLILEAIDEGWWFSACLPDGRRTVSFLTDRDLLPASTRQWPAEFGRLLARTTLMRQHVQTRTWQRCHILRAETSALGQVVGRHWLAVGDAAVAWDPLAGQGVYQAMLSGRRGAMALAENTDQRSEPLSAYQDWTAAHWRACQSAYQANYQAVGRRLRTDFWARRAALPPIPPAFDAIPPTATGEAGRPLADA